MKFEDSVLRTLKNYQIKPARTRVEINDKTVKVIFNIKEASYERSLKGGKTRIIEKRNHPKHGNIYAPYTIRNAEGYDDMKPLTEFERDVLSVCISECCNGTYFITPAIIFRALVGKVGEVGVVPSKDQKAAIVHAVEKLQKTKFNKIFAEAYDLLNYKTNGVTIGEDPLLPSKIAPAKINGQPYEVIFFNRESPLFFHANIKNQIVRYDAHLLDVPNMNNTPRIISIKNYIMRRICEIKLHKQLTPALRFDTIFKNCRIDNLDRKSKSNARNIIFRFFEHLKQHGVIDSYEVNKNKMGNVYHSISFTYSSPNKSVVQTNSAQNSGLNDSNSQNSAQNAPFFNLQKPDYNISFSNRNNSSTTYKDSSTIYNNHSTKKKKKRSKKSKK